MTKYKRPTKYRKQYRFTEEQFYMMLKQREQYRIRMEFCTHNRYTITSTERYEREIKEAIWVLGVKTGEISHLLCLDCGARCTRDTPDDQPEWGPVAFRSSWMLDD